VHLALVLFIFAAFMGIGALVSWVWLPDIQDPREARESPTALENRTGTNAGVGANGVVERNATGQGGGGSGIGDGAEDGAEDAKHKFQPSSYKVPNKPLEELAEGWAKTVERGQVLSFRRKLGIYDLLQPVAVKMQGWFKKRTEKQE
jgi:hypothetical protein